MKKRKDTNLAEGEITGHTHRAIGTNVLVYDDKEQRLLDAPDGCEVTHEEHQTITLPPGRYNIVRAIERDHAAEEARPVRD